LIPALLFVATRQTLQAVNDTTVATAVLFVANGLNALAGYALVRGRFGLPNLGAPGVAVATLASQTFMALAIFAWCAKKDLGVLRVGLRPDPKILREELRLGVPASVQLLLEVGVFSLVALLAARIDAVSAAAHQAVIQIASFTFMVPLGLSVAGAVRVGQAIGREDYAQARRSGSTAVALGALFMLASGLTLTLAWRPILGVFVRDPAVLVLARSMLGVAAVFQLFDGMQVTLSGVLRGAGDTTSSMVANLVGHWALGLPVGCVLAFVYGRGAVGLWVGLAVGLSSVAMALLARWRTRAAALRPGP
jgi:MATE family multidrug resistance protein